MNRHAPVNEEEELSSGGVVDSMTSSNYWWHHEHPFLEEVLQRPLECGSFRLACSR
jgi:hypothetical protein